MQNKVILIIGLVWPEPKSSAAGKRMLQLIALFQKWDYKVVFASTASENEINFDLSELGVEKVSIELNAISFDIFIRNLNPAVVLFDRFVTEEQFGWRVTEHCPKALKMLDSEDLHCLRYTRQASFKKGNSFEIEQLFEQDATKREIASILRCDITLVIAEFEMQILKKYFKIDSQFLFYLPILFTDEELKCNFIPNFDERHDFMFIGNFWHEPNWDAVLYLKKAIWPLIRIQLPKAVIRVYGAYPSQKVFDLNSKSEGFLIMGRAEDARTAIAAARVMIAPLRFGAGIKGKLLEAMLYGTPSITTSIGAESINGNVGWNGFVADDATELSNKAVFLYENDKVWEEAQQIGINILQQRFRWNDFEQPFKIKMESVLDDLTKHRKFNFYGNLLLQNSMKSTEYMAKWIEEKNKNKFLTKV